ncbi:MAG TPA: LysM peptidoglycan-binding domain-containing protein [Acetobacteraceae bacterium]|nr:LysM peptidoglycan-binding domain-containing protein [Acetobacteraceae bacterium]
MVEGQTHLARHPSWRPFLIAAAALVGLAVAGAVIRWEGLLTPPVPAKLAVTAPPKPPAIHLPAPVPAAPAGPSFDVVRVDREGNAVIAGRAPVGSRVTVSLGKRAVGTVTSNDEGQWVLTPSEPLPAGVGTLTLSARLPDGKSLIGPDRVTVAVAAHPGEAPPVALLTGPSETPKLLQVPPAVGARSPLALDLLQYGQHAAMLLAGRAPPNANVRIYVDNHPIGDAHADGSGHWSLRGGENVLPGQHEIRVDQLSPAGTVLARVVVPFDRPEGPLNIAARAVMVRPGDCLWVIAEHAYGSGLRYTLVFQANRNQIRDPRLIYPGQIFILPAPSPAPGGHG